MTVASLIDHIVRDMEHSLLDYQFMPSSNKMAMPLVRSCHFNPWSLLMKARYAEMEQFDYNEQALLQKTLSENSFMIHVVLYSLHMHSKKITLFSILVSFIVLLIELILS